MGVVNGVNTVTDGLIYYIDPSNTNSVSGTGTSIYNLTNSTVAGTFVGYTTNPVDNTENESILIDNVSGYVNGPSNIALTNNFTVSVWFKVNVFNTGAIIGKWYAASGNAHRCWIMNTDTPTSSMAIVLSSDGSYTGPTIKRYLVPVNLNEYTHLTFTFASGTLLVYKNGTLATVTKSIDGSFSSVYDNATRSIQLGYFFDFQNYYNSANIGVVQIYNKVLSSTEILQNYNATKSRYNTTDNIITNGLVYNIDVSKNASYPGTGTTIYDLSGAANTGTIVSSPTFSSSNGGSLVFNGNPYITRSSALNTGQNFSVTAWIYPTALGARNAVVGNGYPFTTDNGWLFCICDNNFSLFQALFLSIGQNNALVISNSYVFQLNKWAHIACSVSGGGSSIKFYVNGVETSYGFTSVSGRTISYADNEFNIGRRHSSTPERFVGNISQVQIYNTTLTAAEIAQNYNATKYKFINSLPSVSDSSLVLNLDAGNRASYAGTGLTWYDLSGRGNNFSLLNGAAFAGSGTTTYMSFDGSNDRAVLPGGINLGTSHTVSVMFKANGVMNSVIFGDIGWSNTGYAFYANNNTLEYAAGNGYNNLTFTGSTNWTYLTVVRNGRSFTFYQNGASLGTLSLSEDSILKLSSLGSYYSGAYVYAGAISIATCYTRALSASEVLQNFNSVRSRYNI